MCPNRFACHESIGQSVTCYASGTSNINLSGSCRVDEMKKFLFALLYATGVCRLVAWANRTEVNILCYHSVTKRRNLPRDPFKLHLQFEPFLRQLDHLQSNYKVISLSDFIRARREKTPLPPHSVVLTFDDGLRNFGTVAAPELLQRGLPATAFLVTDKTSASDNRQPNAQWALEDDETFLSWAEVKTLALEGMEFGSHSCSHSRLSNLSLEAAQRELHESRVALLTHLDHGGIALSYPHGQTSDAISQLAESLGYSCGLTTALGRNGNNSNPFALRRTVIAGDDDLPTFAARVSGLTWRTDKLLGFIRREKERHPCCLTSSNTSRASDAR